MERYGGKWETENTKMVSEKLLLWSYLQIPPTTPIAQTVGVWLDKTNL